MRTLEGILKFKPRDTICVAGTRHGISLALTSAGRAMLQVQCVQRDPRTWVLVVDGAVDHSTVPQLREAFNALLEKGLKRLVIDLERVAFIASAGFSYFLNLRGVIREREGEVVFAGTSARVREVFDLLGVTSFLRFAPDVCSALAQLEGASPTGS